MGDSFGADGTALLIGPISLIPKSIRCGSAKPPNITDETCHLSPKTAGFRGGINVNKGT